MTKTIDALVDALEEFVGILPDDAWDKTLEARKKARAALARARSEQAESVNLSEFEDPQVQTVYEILCADEVPPDGEHWEGFAARRVVAALSTPPAAPANPTAWRYTANGNVILMDGPSPPPDDAYDEGSLIGLAPTCKDGLQVPTDKESLTVAPSAKLKPLTDDEVDALWESSEKFQNPYLAYIHGVVDAEATHNAKLGGA